MPPELIAQLLPMLMQMKGSQQAGMAAIPSEAFKFGLGLSQAIKAHNLAKNTQRPEYQIPNAMNQSLQIAQQLANDTRLPGQSVMEGQISSDTANALRAANELGGGTAEKLAALSGAYQGQQQANQNLGIQAAQQQMQDLHNLQQTLAQYAPYQQQKWEWEKKTPFLDTIEAIRRLREGANKNIYGGIQGLGSAWAMMGGMPQLNQQQQQNLGSFTGGSMKTGATGAGGMMGGGVGGSFQPAPDSQMYGSELNLMNF